MSGVGDEPASLEECRSAIEHVDRQLIALLAARVALARRTSSFKRAAGLPLLDPAREADVIRRAVVEARAKGLPGERVREIFWHVVGLSRDAQQEQAE